MDIDAVHRKCSSILIHRRCFTNKYKHRRGFEMVRGAGQMGHLRCLVSQREMIREIDSATKGVFIQSAMSI